MKLQPIDHIAALELFTCQDHFQGLAGLGTLWDDSFAAFLKRKQRYEALVAKAAPTGYYRNNFDDFVKASRLLDDAEHVSDTWVSGGDLNNSSQQNEMNYSLYQAELIMNDLEAKLPASQPVSIATDEGLTIAARPGWSYSSTPSAPVSMTAVVPPPASSEQYGPPASLAPPARVATGSSEQYGPAVPYGLTVEQYRTLVQSNSSALKTPQAGTMPVASHSALAQSLASMLSSGANVYTQQQIQATLNQAKASGQPVYAPHGVVAQAKALASRSKSSDWLIAGGVGAALLGLMTVFALRRRD